MITLNILTTRAYHPSDNLLRQRPVAQPCHGRNPQTEFGRKALGCISVRMLRSHGGTVVTKPSTAWGQFRIKMPSPQLCFFFLYENVEKNSKLYPGSSVSQW